MRNILITGANRGIGLGLIKSLLKTNQQQRIIGVCRTPSAAQELNGLSQNNANLHIVQLESKNFSEYPRFASQVQEIVQNEGIHLLINNAGIGGKFHRIAMLKETEFIDTLIINTVAPAMLVKHVLPMLKAAADLKNCPTRIVNISSVLGSIEQNDTGGYYSYRCSKAALNSVTRSLSADLKSNEILVTSLHPGWVKTAMGGPKAPLELEPAADKIIHFIEGISQEHNGGVGFDFTHMSK